MKGGKKMATAKIAFENLRAEMARKNINIGDLADTLHIARGTAGRKLARKQPLTLDEAYIITNTFFPEKNVDYLFQETAQKD